MRILVTSALVAASVLSGCASIHHTEKRDAELAASINALDAREVNNFKSIVNKHATDTDLLTGRVNTLDGQVSTLNGQVATIEGQIATLDGQVSTLDGRVSTLDGQVSTLDGQVSTLNGHVTTINGQITSLNGQVTTINGQVSTLNSDVAALKQADVQVFDRLNSLKQADAQILDRANAAYKLAESRFSYNVISKDESITFPPGRTTLGKDQQDKLIAFAKQLNNENQDVQIEIQGHTDSFGEAAYRETLGARRAEAVRLFLHQQGVALNRMSTISYADAKPVDKSQSNQVTNRRVTIVVVK